MPSMIRRLTSAPNPSCPRPLVHLGQASASARSPSGRRRTGPGSPRPRPGRARSRPRSRGARSAARSRTPRRPSSSIFADGLLEVLANAGLDPLGVAGELPRRPRSAGPSGPRDRSSTPPSMPTEVESQGSRPCIARSISAASVTSRVRGRIGPARRRRRSSRSARWRRRWVSCRRCRRARRAGGSSRRCRCRSRRERGAPRRRRRSRPRSRRARARVPGIEDRAVPGVLVGGAHRELVHVGLAEDARARLQLAHRGRGVGRP